MNNAVTRCWICGAAATSGEHIPKSAILRQVFGERTVREVKRVGGLEQCEEFWVAAAYCNALIRLRVILKSHLTF